MVADVSGQRLAVGAALRGEAGRDLLAQRDDVGLAQPVGHLQRAVFPLGVEGDHRGAARAQQFHRDAGRDLQQILHIG